MKNLLRLSIIIIVLTSCVKDDYKPAIVDQMIESYPDDINLFEGDDFYLYTAIYGNHILSVTYWLNLESFDIVIYHERNIIDVEITPDQREIIIERVMEIINLRSDNNTDR